MAVRMIALLLAAVLAFGQAPQAFQQSQESGQPDTVIRINVNLVQVDAVVTDAKDHLVTDLKAEDFEILQDGKPQQITHFAFINTKAATTRVEQVSAPAVKAAVPAPPPPPQQLKSTQVRRTFALVVDDLGLSFESIAQVRAALKKFVDTQMQPGDLVAIVRTGAGMGALQNFTSDKRMLYAAIDRVKFNGFGRVGVSSFEPLSGASETADGEEGGDASGFDTRNEEFRETWFSVGTLGAINYVINGLRELPGRKSVVLFSENMRMFNSEGMNDQVMDNMRRLTDAANRASVVIYTIDPRGLPTLSLTAADNTRGMRPQQLSEVHMRRSQQYWDSQEGLNFLADETGGIFFHDNNDISAGVRRVVDDQEGYYLIGYHPDAKTFDEKTGRPKFLNVKVRVKRPGLKVRSRKGFFGTSDQEKRPVPRGRDEQLMHALVSPFGSSGIPLRLTALFSVATPPKPGTPEAKKLAERQAALKKEAKKVHNGKNGKNAPGEPVMDFTKGGPMVVSLLHIDCSGLSFTDELAEPADAKKAGGKVDAKSQEPWKKTVIDILVTTFGDNGQEVDHSNRTFTVRMRGETLKQAMQYGMVYSVVHPIKKPGAYQLRVAVRDATSERVGSASQYIEVPDINKGHLALSGLVLRSYVPQGSAGVPGKEGKVEEPDPKGSPALRVFHPGKLLTYGYQVVNAKVETGKKTELEARMRLFHDGKEVYSGKPIVIDASQQPDLRNIIAGGRLQLGSKMEAGEYTIQVVVTDKLAPQKARMAAQYMNFEIER